MLSWRRKRQIQYILGFLAFWLVVFGLVYVVFFWPEKEDPCPGGICPWEIRPLDMIWAKALPVRDGLYSVVVFYENRNEDLGLPFFRYNIRLLDDNLEEITSVLGEAYANPRDVVILFEDRVSLTQEPTQILVDFPEELRWQRLNIEMPIIRSQRIGFANEPNPVLTGRAINEFIFGLNNIRIPVFLADEKREIFATSQTFVDNLARGESKEFFYTWPEPFDQEPVFIDFYPRINMFELN
ncbi:MAG TPA: hypothetical protein ENN31_00605 [Candidatus Vogelbacteria bacterium]|nr:hypothetical protein [Candidatus Vogelbacteria bacterium]